MKLSLRILPLLATAGLAFAGCGGASDSTDGEPSASGSSGGGGAELSLVAYSTPEVVYEKLIPGFQATPEGEGVTFKTSYGASGDQSRAVEAGLTADVVALSLEPDITRLVEADMLASDWKSQPNKGIASNSVVVFMVRKGNPKNIQTWEDLLEPDVEVLNPNPFQSGGAKWNILAAYGANGALDGDPEAGLEYVRKLITEHIKVQDESARDSLATFTGGQGDVLLGYENEAILAQDNGEDIEYVIPEDTLLIETPIAPTTTSEYPEQAQAFVDYVWSDEGQKFFAEEGYRPVVKSVFDEYADTFPVPGGLFTVDEIGGWETLNTDLFNDETGSIAEIERSIGVSTEK